MAARNVQHTVAGLQHHALLEIVDVLLHPQPRRPHIRILTAIGALGAVVAAMMAAIRLQLVVLMRMVATCVGGSLFVRVDR